MFYGYCKETADHDRWPTGLAFGFFVDCPNLKYAVPELGAVRYLVPAKRGDEVVAYSLQNEKDKADGVFFTFYPGMFHRDIVQVRDFAHKNAVDREVIALTVGPVVTW